MAFGQASGPPATKREIEELELLLEQHDYGTFREARHKLGLTQRQAGGKFTRGEVSELIERLAEAVPDAAADAPAVEHTIVADRADRAERKLQAQREELVAAMPAQLLAAELERRGWCCIAPTPQ